MGFWVIECYDKVPAAGIGLQPSPWSQTVPLMVTGVTFRQGHPYTRLYRTCRSVRPVLCFVKRSFVGSVTFVQLVRC